MWKVSQCEWCGDDLGGAVEKWPGEMVTCGKRACDHEAREDAKQRREEAHEQLDRDLGY